MTTRRSTNEGERFRTFIAAVACLASLGILGIALLNYLDNRSGPDDAEVAGATVTAKPTVSPEGPEDGTPADPTTTPTTAPTSTPRADADPARMSLGDLEPVENECGADLRLEPSTVDDVLYPRSLTWHLPKNSEICTAVYALHDDWISLRGAVGIRDDSEPGARALFEIFVDDRRILLEQDLIVELGEQAKPFVVELNDAKQVKLVTTNLAVGTLQSWVWASPELIGPS